MESELRHKLFPPNAWMKVLHFNILTSCPKDELHQWFIGLYGEHIIPAIVHRYTKVLQPPDLVTVDRDGNSHPLLSNEAVARVFKRLADRLQGVVSDTSTIIITQEYNFGRPQPRIGGLSVAETEGLDSPGLKRPGELQKPGRPGSGLLTRYDKHIPGIYLSYVPTQ
jgi:hypothetical protein